MQVKALPWYSSVRALLNDSRYSGFFLKFNKTEQPFHVPQCDAASGRCTEYCESAASRSGVACCGYGAWCCCSLDTGLSA